MIDRSSLKSCPFCGSDHIDLEADFLNKAALTCMGCGARGPLEEELEGTLANLVEAARRWNDRVDSKVALVSGRDPLPGDLCVCGHSFKAHVEDQAGFCECQSGCPCVAFREAAADQEQPS